MLINFRQGIVETQPTPAAIALGGGQVNLNTNMAPTILSFADGSSDYLFIENTSSVPAWAGPFTLGTDYWLYWDIDKTTANRTFGTTLVEPTFGTTRPSSPLNDQHFFDTSINKMVVWNGQRWIEKLRIFAAKLENGSTLIRETVGTSQVGLDTESYSGEIVLAPNGLPVVRANGEFLTTQTPTNSQDNPLNSYKIESLQIRAKAVEPIPIYHCVAYKGPNQTGLATNRSPDRGRCIGVSVENTLTNEMRKYVTFGYVTNPAWNFTENPGTLVFVGNNGQVTTDVPTKISLQRIGTVVSSDTILVDIGILFRIVDPLIPSPTPSPSPSASVTPTPTRTPPVTATPTPSATQTAAVTVTPTPTLTVTPTLTATLTPTPTPSSTTLPPGADGFLAGGYGPTAGTVVGFPFAAPFTGNISLGSLILTSEDIESSGTSSETDGYIHINGNSATFFQQIHKFPLSPTSITTSVAGSFLAPQTYGGSGLQSQTDGYFSEGIPAPFPSAAPTATTVGRFPFSASFTNATSVGELGEGHGFAAPASSATDGYLIGGQEFSHSTNPSGGGATDEITIFPFAAPFASYTTIGKLNSRETDSLGVGANSAVYDNENVFFIEDGNVNIETFPFTNTFATSTLLSNVVGSREGGTGVFSETDGYIAGGYYFTASGTTRFPFSAAFTSTTDVGTLGPSPSRATGHQRTAIRLPPIPTPTPTPTPAAIVPQTVTDAYIASNVLDTGLFAEQRKIDTFPFAAPFGTTASNFGQLTNEATNKAGNKSTTDGYVSGGGNTVSYPFAAPFVETTEGVLTIATLASIGVSSITDGYLVGGIDPSISPFLKGTLRDVQSFPFASSWTTTITGNFVGIEVNRAATASIPTSKGIIASGATDPYGNTIPQVTKAIQSFPYNAPFATSDIIGSLTDGRQTNAGMNSDIDGFAATGINPTISPSVTLNVEKYELNSPTLTTGVDIGTLAFGRYDAMGASSPTDGYLIGGKSPFPQSGLPVITGPENIERFPFASPFASTVDVGDLRFARDRGSVVEN
jgi:hypothetical protein